MSRLLILVAALSLFFGLVAPRLHTAAPAPAVASVAATTPTPAPATTAPPTVAITNGTELSLARDPSGHFRTDASVNGQSLPFVVDTGADIVALTIDDARRVGLYVDPTSFTVIAQGASGPVRGQQINLDRIEIAGRTLDHVRAAVLEGLGQNLLGQSVLTKLGGVEMKGDKMVLR